jgi:iron-sulfur cluster repair protein YtfE (RIC family)
MVACSLKPMHRQTDRLEQTAHAALRSELSLIVDLAQEELARTGRESLPALRRLHASAELLRDAAIAHFRREELRLFPLVRLAEDGVRARALIGQLVFDLRRDHDRIRNLIDTISVATGHFTPPPASPLVTVLFRSLAAVARDLVRHFEDEEQGLFSFALRALDEQLRTLRPAS